MGTNILIIIGVLLVYGIWSTTNAEASNETIIALKLTTTTATTTLRTTISSLTNNSDNTENNSSNIENVNAKPKPKLNSNESEEHTSTKATGRSLNFDIEKYVSPEFHNKNNVYTLPTSPEIDKFVERPNFEDSSLKLEKHLDPSPTDTELQIGLTTPRSDIFDKKYKRIASRIKQNLEELEIKRTPEENKYDVTELINNVKNADNNTTNVTLHTIDSKHLEIKSDEKQGSKVEEINKTIDYQSTFLEEKPENIDVNNIPYNNNEEKKSETQSINESVTTQQIKPTELITTIRTTHSTTTFVPTKKTRLEFSLRNNTIETSAPENVQKSKTLKHFPDAINISKRVELSTTQSFNDNDDKKFTLPSTATAWTLVSLKNVPISTTIPTTIKNKEETNNYVKVEELTSTSEHGDEISTELITTRETISENTENDEINDTTIVETTAQFETTTETDSATGKSDMTSQTNEYITYTTELKSTSDSTESISTTNEETTVFNLTNTELPSTLSEIITSTEVVQQTEQSTNLIVPKSTKFETTDATSTSKIQTTKTESENELFTTKPEFNTTENVLEKVESILPNFETRPTISTEIKSSEADEYNETIELKHINNVPEIVTTVALQNKTTVTERSLTTSTTKFLTSTYNREHTRTENTTTDSTSSTEHLSNNDNENNAGMIAAITISAVGGVCLIMLAGLLLIMRKRQKRMTYGQRCRPVSLDAYSLDNVSVYNSVRRKGAARASKRSYGNPAFDDPASITHLMNFQTLSKFADNLEEINAEFEEIPQVTVRASEVPVGCETKNRYANVIPLPETRVFLKASDNDPNSDYINANYVTGPKNTYGYYIACQGPLQSTVDDFWRMVWEQQCRVILMLTDLVENGIEKCADYLPPSEVVDCHRLFGDFQITLKKREVKEKYIISSLQLKNMVSNSWREVTHLWYLGWPERGVPTETNSLIAFLIEARSHLKAASNNNSTSNQKTSETSNMHISGTSGSESGPMVMHCSPGTGRTGTVIACDIAIRDFELTRSVDIPKIVYRVRRDRASAVQTKEQYAFIYKVISLYATKLTGGALDSI